MKLTLLVISPLLAAPTFVRREAPFTFNFSGTSSKSTETKTTSGGEVIQSEPVEESSSSWFGVSNYGLDSALKFVAGSKPSKKTLKKSIISSILPLSSGAHNLREAKDELKDALNNSDPANPFPFKEVIDLREGFDSFADGAIETASRLMNPLNWVSGGNEGDEEALRAILEEEKKLKEKEEKDKEKEKMKEKEKEKKKKKKEKNEEMEEKKKKEKKEKKKKEKKTDESTAIV